jgi:hypothetical protein
MSTWTGFLAGAAPCRLSCSTVGNFHDEELDASVASLGRLLEPVDAPYFAYHSRNA